MESSSREQFDTIIAQITTIKSNHADKVQVIDSKFKEIRDSIQHEIQQLEQRRQQLEQEHQIAIETEEQSYNEQINPYLAIFSLPKQQEDGKAPGEEIEQEEVNKPRDENENTEQPIIVIDSDTESVSTTLQTAMGGLSDTLNDDVGTSEQPAPRNLRRRKRPAIAEYTDNDVQANAPQTKKIRRTEPSNTSVRTASGAYTEDPSNRSRPDPYDIVEPPTRPPVRRDKEVFKGITDPAVGEIYKVQDKRFPAGYAVLVLPLGNFDVIGISRSIRDTSLIKKVPPCYRYDEQDMSFGWRRDYEDDGPKVMNRKFACMCFHRGKEEIPLEGEFTAANEDFCWISAKVIRRLNLQTKVSRVTRGWKGANRFSERLKLIRERQASGSEPVDATVDTSTGEEVETDAQIPREEPSVTHTGEPPDQPAVDDAPEDNPQAPDSPSGRFEQNPLEEQTENPFDNSSERRESRLPLQPQRDPWSLRTLEEINQQNPDPLPGELGYGSDGTLRIPEHEPPEEEDRKPELEWLPKPLRDLTNVEDAVNVDWGNSAAFMEAIDGPHGLEVVTPRAESPRTDACDDSQTLRANDDLASPLLPPERPEATMPSAPGTRTRDERDNQEDPGTSSAPLRAIHRILAEGDFAGRQFPSNLRNAATEALRLRGRF
ncbi:hypothetical protein Hte_007816 [Hypoxylon texense]